MVRQKYDGPLPFKFSTITDVIKLKSITALNHRFDIINSDSGSFDEENYFVVPIRLGEQPIPGPPTEYRLNSEGFRSKHFKKIDESKVNILFAGCSWTFGEGVMEKDGWAEVLSNNISKELGKDVDMYNVSVMGGSPLLTIKNMMGFIREYGVPDYIFSVIPSHTRDIVFDSATDQFFNGNLVSENISSMIHRKDIKRYINSYDPRDAILRVFTMLGLFEDFCKAANIKFLWSSYDKALVENEEFGVSNFVKDSHVFLPNDGIAKISDTGLYPNINNIPYWETAYDGQHPGAAWHYDISKTFLSSLRDRGML